MFIQYYKGLKVFETEEEWDTFWKACHAPLPTTFRITPTLPFYELVRYRVQSHFSETLKETKIEEEGGRLVPPPRPLDWYPDEMGWFYSLGRNEIRKYRTIESLQEFHYFLTTQTENGNISRQEAVSMIPPFFLDVQPHHLVLDMCASPGSKSCQMVEFLHRDIFKNPKQLPTGVVVANDVDEKRCFTLAHQLKRLQSPCTIVTKAPAQHFPFFWTSPPDVQTTSNNLFQFDRILCDVPCSGDGTSRKNPDVWLKWLPSAGTALHKLQVSIAKRGVRLLKPGGRMVYSTCSLNPIENEAVICAVMEKYPEVELVDVSNVLPGLKSAPALRTWRVYDHSGNWYDKHEDLPPKRKSKVAQSCFPPSQEKIAEYHLERCIRVYHHLQDTGGFFIAVFQKKEGEHFWAHRTRGVPGAEKTETIEKEKEAVEQMSDDEEPSDPQEPSSPRPSKPSLSSAPSGGAATFFIPQRRDDGAVVPLGESQKDEVEAISNFFGIDISILQKNVISRSESGAKALFYISDGVFTFLCADKHRKSHILNTGLKIMKKHMSKDDIACNYRLVSEGLPVIAPHITKRIVRLSKEDLVVLLNIENAAFSSFTAQAKADLEQHTNGSILYVVQLEHKYARIGTLYYSGWRGNSTCHLLLSKVERRSLLLMLQEVDRDVTSSQPIN